MQPLRKPYFLSKLNCLAENQCERGGRIVSFALGFATRP